MSLEAPRKTEQIPHSGKSGLEAPVREFDKTPLEQAVQEGLIKTPDHVTGLTETKEKKSRKKLFVGIGATAAVALGAAGAIFGVNAAANQETQPKEEPVATAPANPSESEAPAPVETEPNEGTETPTVPSGEHDPAVTPENSAELLASLEISANLSPEQVAEKLAEIDSRWFMAGATPELWYNMDYSMSTADYVSPIAEANTEVFASAMFGEDYQNTTNESVTNFIEARTESNKKSLDLYLTTYGDEDNPHPNPENTEPLNISFSASDVYVFEQDDQTLRMEYTSTQSNNADKTMFTQLTENNGSRFNHEVTLTKVDDHYIVTDVQVTTLPQ